MREPRDAVFAVALFVGVLGVIRAGHAGDSTAEKKKKRNQALADVAQLVEKRLGALVRDIEKRAPCNARAPAPVGGRLGAGPFCPGEFAPLAAEAVALLDVVRANRVEDGQDDKAGFQESTWPNRHLVLMRREVEIDLWGLVSNQHLAAQSAQRCKAIGDGMVRRGRDALQHRSLAEFQQAQGDADADASVVRGIGDTLTKTTTSMEGWERDVRETELIAPQTAKFDAPWKPVVKEARESAAAMLATFRADAKRAVATCAGPALGRDHPELRALEDQLYVALRAQLDADLAAWRQRATALYQFDCNRMQEIQDYYCGRDDGDGEDATPAPPPSADAPDAPDAQPDDGDGDGDDPPDGDEADAPPPPLPDASGPTGAAVTCGGGGAPSMSAGAIDDREEADERAEEWRARLREDSWAAIAELDLLVLRAEQMIAARNGRMASDEAWRVWDREQVQPFVAAVEAARARMFELAEHGIGKGAAHPLIRVWIEYGRQQHALLEGQAEFNCALADVGFCVEPVSTWANRNKKKCKRRLRPDCVSVDPASDPPCTIYEFKPEGAEARGTEQVCGYKKLLEAHYGWRAQRLLAKKSVSDPVDGERRVLEGVARQCMVGGKAVFNTKVKTYKRCDIRYQCMNP